MCIPFEGLPRENALKRDPWKPYTTLHAAYVAELRYVYTVAGQEERGSYKRELASEVEAQDFIRDLKGKPVAVQYDRNKPLRSGLSEASVETLCRLAHPSRTANSYLPQPQAQSLTGSGRFCGYSSDCQQLGLCLASGCIWVP